MTVRLKAMTWSHPRGYDPMIACSRLWNGKDINSTKTPPGVGLGQKPPL